MDKRTSFQVWSTHGELDPAPAGDVLESCRTSKEAAAQDRDLISSILHRACWIREIAS